MLLDPFSSDSWSSPFLILDQPEPRPKPDVRRSERGMVHPLVPDRL